MQSGFATTPNAVVFALHFSVGNAPAKSTMKIALLLLLHAMFCLISTSQIEALV
jgi:hypothetical protein